MATKADNMATYWL